MAVIVYQCDTCKRRKQFTQTPNGLETVGRCTITLGCRGQLFQERLLRDFSRPKQPDPVEGLDDWLQRRVLYNHTQVIQSKTWTVTHNLGTLPFVDVLVDVQTSGRKPSQESFTPEDIITIDENTTELRFDRPRSGKAQFIARQSDPKLLTPNVAPERETVDQDEDERSDTMQVTHSNVLTIAVLDKQFGEDVTMTLNTVYDPSDDSPTTLSHTFDYGSRSKDSPWNNVSDIFIRGKKYNVRTFDIANQTTTISSGSSITFDSVSLESSEQPIKKNQILILLAKEPFENVDIITDRFIDISTVVGSSMFLDGQEMFADSTAIQTIFPPIRIL